MTKTPPKKWTPRKGRTPGPKPGASKFALASLDKRHQHLAAKVRSLQADLDAVMVWLENTPTTPGKHPRISVRDHVLEAKEGEQ